MEYRESRVEDPRSPIFCVWELSGNSTEEQRIVPDGQAEVIVHFGAPFQEFRNGVWNRQKPSVFCGQLTRPLVLRADGTTRTLGLRLNSWATASVCEDVASVFTDQVVDGETVDRSLLQVACCEVDRNGSADLHAMARRLSRFSPTKRRAESRVRAVVLVAKTCQGQCTVDDLSRVANASSRQLDRLMLEAVGVTPKVFLRLLRFRNVMAHAEVPGARWVEIAAACGYYDQSHMLRDFAQFVGKTPSQAFASSSDLARCFLPAGEEQKRHP
jgi:AraC-like DNA-binding protein